ncbi:LysR family transcriptional regulator, glycine cleavage system transcriptional activator [Shimia gijangensis]|uniref:LysR family transcriptional regulator, glycine cleavage system transcriptional activator n=1 Tax=Shimia gijangensis TaxID=1470563 RepID=A0A1M6SWZ9_9RHOB|nr:LysR substrate-binding domain-containing protein [Shimia gijangensis]SHK49187.1 LysR family transcriptional regulator, glycine cleavage system transcriptional activator [Shimia gijangensis]
MTLDWTKLPSLTSLRAFEAAARAKSFSAAARSLNVTHAAVAQQVRVLEEFIGMQLLERSARGVSLTSEGQELANALANGFAAIAEGIETLQEKDRSRPVRVTTTAYFAEAVIFPRIAEFWSTAPRIEISFAPTDDPIDLVAEGFDIGIRAGDGNWPDLKCRLLLESPTRAFAASSLVDDPATNWDEVPWLIPSSSFWEREALKESGIDTSAIKTLEIGDPSLEIRAAEEGMGLVVESEIDVRAQVRAKTLKIAPIPVTSMSRYFIVMPPWKPRPAVAAFVNWLETVGPSFGEENSKSKVS